VTSSRFLAAFFLVAIVPTIALAQQSLERIHAGIVDEYNNIEHVGAGELLAMSPSDVLLFDVREQDEFTVSHIQGSIQVDPDIDEDAFAERYGSNLEGKTAIFYCSVGRRSSQLASKLDEFIQEKNGVGAANLIGGVFQWRNESRPLVSINRVPTNQVHPYNWYWGRLIEDKGAISYQPQSD